MCVCVFVFGGGGCVCVSVCVSLLGRGGSDSSFPWYWDKNRYFPAGSTCCRTDRNKCCRLSFLLYLLSLLSLPLLPACRSLLDVAVTDKS